MQLVFSDLQDGGRHLKHLMPQRLRISALQGLPTPPTLRGFTDDHLLHLLHGEQRTLVHGMPRLGSPLAARGRAWRLALDLRPVRRRRPRGVLRVLPEVFLQFPNLALQLPDFGLQSGNAPLVPLHHDPDGGLEVRRNLVPQLLGQGRLSPHDIALHILAAEFTQVWGVNGHTTSNDERCNLRYPIKYNGQDIWP